MASASHAASASRSRVLRGDDRSAPPRILFAASIDLFAFAFLTELAQECRSRGWQVDLACSRTRPDLRLPDCYNAVHEVWWGRAFTDARGAMRSAARIRRVLQESDYDIVHVHTPSAAAVLRVVVATLRRPPLLIHTAHGFSFGDEAIGPQAVASHLIERALINRCDVLELINRDDFRWAVRHRRASLSTVLGRGMGIRDEFLDEELPDRASARHALGIPASEFVALTVGELSVRKRPTLALQSVAAMGGGPRRSVLVGSGESEPSARSVAVALQSDAPGFVGDLRGDRHDLATFLAAADALLHTSRREGLPTVVLEAMAVGLPIVAVDIGGVRDLLGDAAGILVRRGNPGSLAAGLRLIRQRPQEALGWATRAWQRARAYRRSTLAARTADSYHTLMESPRT